MIANLPDVLLGFQPRKRKACNHVRPIASSHFLVFPPPTPTQGQALHFLMFVKCVPSYHTPDSDLLLGLKGGLGGKIKATFW